MLCNKFALWLFVVAHNPHRTLVRSRRGSQRFWAGAVRRWDAAVAAAQTCLSSQFHPSRSVTLVSTRRRSPLPTQSRKESLQTFFAGSSLAGGSRPSTRCQTRVFIPCSSKLRPCFAAFVCWCLRLRWLLGSVALCVTFVNGACAHGLVLLCVHLRRGLRCRALLCTRARVLVPDSESCDGLFLHPVPTAP